MSTTHNETMKDSLFDSFGLSVMISFLFCILASNVLVQIPLIGGGLYLLGRVAVFYGRWLHPISFAALSKKQRLVAYILLSVTLVIALFLIITVPIALDNTKFWLLLLLVFLITERPLIAKHYLDADIAKSRKPTAMLFDQVLVHFALLAVLAALLFIFLAAETAWYLLAGYALTTIFDSFAVWHNRYLEDEQTPGDDFSEDALKLSQANAFRTFQNLLLVTVAALQVTLIMSYIFIGCTASELLLCMGIAITCMGGAYYIAGLLMDKTFFKFSLDPSNVLIIGLAVWIVGILMFSANIVELSLVKAYLSLSLCALGAGVATRVLMRLKRDMRSVAAFAIGHEPTAAYDRAIHFRMETATLCGQLLALMGITLICLFNLEPYGLTVAKLTEGIRPLLVVPALLLVFAALFCALLFPMTKQHLNKLHKFMELSSDGKQNLPLRNQLEAVVIRRSLKHYGVKIIMALIRPFYYHKIVGRELVPNEADIVNIFVCNHGEIYGPIVTNLYVPFSFRPWVIADMMDQQAIIDSTVKGTLTRFKWLPAKMRLPIAKAVAPFIAWVMRSVDSIPVYYNEPRKLMNSFKESIAAMEAGDNILLFPENSADTPDHRYKLSGVSHFYTGFTMLGQLYYNKTGKCANFIPIYADKHKRTLTFGSPTKYNPDLPASDEKDRLCTYLRGEMMRISGTAETDNQQSIGL